jgi:hypothetical protein
MIMIGAGNPLALEIAGKLERALQFIERPVLSSDEVLTEKLRLHEFSCGRE